MRDAPEMELRHLRCFVALAEELSFAKAVKTLRLAQPSLTRQVRNLEDQLASACWTARTTASR